MEKLKIFNKIKKFFLNFSVVRKRSLLFLLLISLSRYISIRLYGLNLTPHLTYLGKGAEIVGLIFAISWIISAFSSILGGLLIEILDTKLTLLLSFILGILGLISFSLTENLFFIIFIIILLTIIPSIYAIAEPSIIGNLTTKNERGKVNSTFMGLSSFIGILLPVLWGITVFKKGTKISFIISAIFLGVCIILTLIGFSSKSTINKKKNVKNKTIFLDFLKSGRYLFQNINLRYVTIAIIFLALSFMAIDPFLYMFLIKDLNFNTKQIGNILSIGEAVFVLSMIPSGLIADKIGRKLPMVIGSILFSSSLIGFSVSKDFITFTLLWMITRFGTALFLPSQNAIIQDLAPVEKIGAIFGFIMFASNLSAGLGSLPMGIINNNFGPRTMFLVACVISFLIPIFIVLIKEE